jgi:ABC-type glycerol-3-phosphate transport system substrate-binding protein
MRARTILLAAALMLVPLGARAADLVVWWDKGYSAREDQAVEEVVAAFEQKAVKDIELVFQPEAEHLGRLRAALDAGHPPDFLFGILLTVDVNEWAHNGQLVDLSDVL